MEQHQHKHPMAHGMIWYRDRMRHFGESRLNKKQSIKNFKNIQITLDNWWNTTGHLDDLKTTMNITLGIGQSFTKVNSQFWSWAKKNNSPLLECNQLGDFGFVLLDEFLILQHDLLTGQNWGVLPAVKYVSDDWIKCENRHFFAPVFLVFTIK